MKIFNKADIYILIILAVVSLGWMMMQNAFSKNGSYAEVYVDNVLQGSYSLDEDIEIEIKGCNSINDILAINNGYAYMKEAQCPDQYCVEQKHINKANETIVCLPAKIIVKILSNNSDNNYDAVSQ